METQQPLRVLCLTGFMGAGKTSVGRALAAQLGWRFVDLDAQVEQQAGCSIAEMFRTAGESAFRAAESAAIEGLLREAAHSATVVALGGGTLSQPPNAHRLRQAGVATVFLDAPLDVLRQRCQATAWLRPLFGDEASFQRLYEARLTDYQSASLRVDTANHTPEEVAKAIVLALRLDKAGQLSRR